MIIHMPKYTMRTISSIHGTIEPEIFDILSNVTLKILDYLKIEEHLFITVVAGTHIVTGDGPEDAGFGAYTTGLRSIIIAGLIPDDDDPDFDFTREEWIDSLKETLIHEIIHYKQDLDEVLEDTEENESLTEEMTRRLMKQLAL